MANYMWYILCKVNFKKLLTLMQIQFLLVIGDWILKQRFAVINLNIIYLVIYFVSSKNSEDKLSEESLKQLTCIYKCMYCVLE